MSAMEHIEKKVGDIDRNVSSILQILKGNELDKSDTGMIGVQNDHEKRLTGLEKIKDRLTYLLIGMALPAGWGMIDIIQKLILK